MYIYIERPVYICIFTYKYICIYINVHIHIYIYRYILICVLVSNLVRVNPDSENRCSVWHRWIAATGRAACSRSACNPTPYILNPQP